MIDIKQPYYKAPDESVDFGIDWTRVLKSTDSIAQSVWTVPEDFTTSQEQVTGKVTSCFLHGGTLNTRAQIFNKITTTLGAVFERFIVVEVEYLQA